MMIDAKKLNAIYDAGGVYALQLEVGDICHQGCVYCYMNALPRARNTLSDDTIEGILDAAKRLSIVAIEWLGGEPLLRDAIFEHMAHARNLGLRNNVWTGGLPLDDDAILRKTAELTAHGLISVHIPTVDPKTYARLHPGRPGTDLPRILSAIERLLDLDYPSAQILNSLTFTGLQSADDLNATIDYFEDRYGISSCINVYHTYLRPGQPRSDLERLIPDQKAVARVYQRYARHVKAESVPMNCVNKQYCSATVAVLCDGSITPCATIREPDAPHVERDGGLYEVVKHNIDHLTFAPLRDANNLPAECQVCELSDCCWGCRARAYAAGLGMYGRDPRCFRQIGD